MGVPHVQQDGVASLVLGQKLGSSQLQQLEHLHVAVPRGKVGCRAAARAEAAGNISLLMSGEGRRGSGHEGVARWNGMQLIYVGFRFKVESVGDQPQAK